MKLILKKYSKNGCRIESLQEDYAKWQNHGLSRKARFHRSRVSSHRIFQWPQVSTSIDSEYCDPVDGVVVIDEEYMRGRKVYGQLVTVYRYGREEDEVMGVKFSKEMILTKEQIFPMVNAKVKSNACKRV